MNLLIIMIICLMLIYWFRETRIEVEGFSISPCPNCGQKDKLQCFQCDSCGWGWNDQGYGQCLPGNEQGPYFAKDIVKWEYTPDPIDNYKYYLPGWRQWWWGKASPSVRDRLRSRYIFKQPLQI